MILYTTTPLEIVFANNEKDAANRQLTEVNGIPVLVEIAGDEAEIIQVMSTDPMHFLQQEVNPGQKIKLSLK
ncbi:MULTISPECIES: YlzJ-like family protein [Bacillus]|uniref:Uncharacterized protein n=2 Tax=Bacillus TaxID=1386 RepID=A0A0M5JBA1_9BACI|nr:MULTISPECIES: YlzJ-like family protein [Bacillus]ALC81107.1 hypothetical protein AM592_05495 [Bacillus gobiensis]MBP1080072.1 hypothetical protein [Bacillus capparidis]MED1095461.1 YlzJ-like family protein [Bacillus capparidis]